MELIKAGLGALGGGFNAAQQFYNMGAQQQASAPAAPAAEGWTCKCGTTTTGKFCTECGSKKPSGIPQYKCGWQPADPTKAPKFCPECGDPFDNGDIV